MLNDSSARDVQAEDLRKIPLGPVVKSKTFANSIGADVLTADELPDWQAATGRVRVDGEVWCEGATAGAAHDVGAMLAYASAGERLSPGDTFSTGTMPGCCGLELDRWIELGQTVELEIDGIGTLSNRISADAQALAVDGPNPTHTVGNRPVGRLLGGRRGHGEPAVDADLYAPAVIEDSAGAFAAIRDAGPVVWLTRHRMWAMGASTRSGRRCAMTSYSSAAAGSPPTR